MGIYSIEVTGTHDI